MSTAHRVVAAVGLGGALLSVWAGCTSGPAHDPSSSDASASDAGAPGCAMYDGGAGSLFGMTCPTQCDPCCDPAWAQECLAQGGVMERCNSVSCSEAVSGTCEPPPALEAGTFQCAATGCNVGQVCIHSLLGPMDGCEQHHCAQPPPPCADAATCACLSAVGSASGSFGQFVSCAQDDAGNATASYSP